MGIKKFLKDWTLPCAIVAGSLIYLTFYWVPQLDAVGNTLGPIIDAIFPMMVFCTLFSTFCRVDSDPTAARRPQRVDYLLCRG